MTNNKLLSLESLRGIAALSVALYHFQIGSHFHNDFVTNAWLMVDFFFVLSGFVIALNYEHRLTEIRDVINFQKKRFFRLYPLHIVMLVLFFGLETASNLSEGQVSFSDDSTANSKNNTVAFIANATLLHNWTLSKLTFNYPSWSISAEFYTYAIFGALALFTSKLKKGLYAISIILIIVSAVILAYRGMTNDNISGPLRCIYSFFLGVVTCALYRNFELEAKLKTSFTALSMLAISVGLVIILGSSKAGYNIVLPLFFSVAILSLVATDKTCVLNKLLSNSKLVYLGTISYGIYMVHALVWKVYKKVMTSIFDFSSRLDSDGTLQIVVENRLLADLISISGIVIILICAHLSYKYIESRFTRQISRTT